MSDSTPTLSPKGQAEALDRQKRQAEALRANLLRRKAQARARDDAQPDDAQSDDAPQPEPKPCR